ncbi:unnamed protein product, partial [Didymodactylos carnosus]
TPSGRVLTNAITHLVEKWYSRILPSRITNTFINALLYIVGGETFHRKLGLTKPSSISLYTVYALATIRKFFMQFMPPRIAKHRLSDNLMKTYYSCPATRSTFTNVGPPKVIATMTNDSKAE